MNNVIRRPLRYVNFNAVYWLIGINVFIYMLCSEQAVRFFGPALRYFLLTRMSMIPVLVIRDGWIWTFVTYMFMHGNLGHVLFNMLGLFIFGMHVERQMGSKEFLLFYLVTGTLAGIFSFIVYFFTRNFLAALMGASGALFAVQLAYAVFFPNSIIYIWGILPIRAPVMVLGFTVLSIFYVITGRGGNVAHLTHLAGYIFGWFYFLIRFGINPWQRLTGR